MSELLDTINCPRCGLGIDVHVPSRQVEAREAEVERLQARERELVSHLDYRETIEPFMEDLAVLLNGSPTTDAQLLSEAIFEIESLRAAVSAEKEES